MTPTHPAILSSGVLLKDCDEVRTRRSGPGGQHRNKTETAVILVHKPTGISAEASERRSQAENRRVALGRLRLRLALEHREPAGVRASESWRGRVRGRRLVVSRDHEDVPALIAEALDQLHAAGFEIPLAAHKLGVTGTQLVRLFKKCPAAWVVLNGCRETLGLSVLK